MELLVASRSGIGTNSIKMDSQAPDTVKMLLQIHIPASWKWKESWRQLEANQRDVVVHTHDDRITFRSQVAVTGAGSLPCKKIIHAVGPDALEIKDATRCEELLKDTFVNVFKCANDDPQILTVAVPMISTGIFSVPVASCAAAFWRALDEFRQHHYRSPKSLKTIVVADLLADSVRELIDHCRSTMRSRAGFDVVSPAPSMELTQGVARALSMDAGGDETVRRQCVQCQSELTESVGYMKRSGLLLCLPCGQGPLPTQDIPRCASCSVPLPPTSYFITIDHRTFLCYMCIAAKRQLTSSVTPHLTSSPHAGVPSSSERLVPEPDASTLGATGHAPLVQGGPRQRHSPPRFEPVTDDLCAICSKSALSSASRLLQCNHRCHESCLVASVRTGVCHCPVCLTEFGDDISAVQLDPAMPTPGATAAAPPSSKHPRDTTGRRHESSSEAAEDRQCPVCPRLIDSAGDCHTLQCSHRMHKSCFEKHFAEGHDRCPTCFVVDATITGTQPVDGKMASKITKDLVPGYPDADGAIFITYSFPNGTQGSEHPNPGKAYRGTVRDAYLPNNAEGQLVLKLLERAFKQRLVFAIGQSMTTGQKDVIVWNDIEHKTSLEGGPTRFGYPDAAYLKRVRTELAAFGIA